MAANPAAIEQSVCVLETVTTLDASSVSSREAK